MHIIYKSLVFSVANLLCSAKALYSDFIITNRFNEPVESIIMNLHSDIVEFFTV